MHSQYAPVAPPHPALTVDDLSVVFARTGRRQRVLDGLGFALAPGEIGCLLGASGCGKSTALRAIAGFVRPERGTVQIGGRTVVGPGA
jgi:iron(III) transport system ATP-binding protein